MTFPKLDLGQIWWHSGKIKEIDTSDQHINGGLHIGTFLQASDRQKPGRTYYAFTVKPDIKIAKSRDLYMDWQGLANKKRRAGVQAIAYINRHEGFGRTSVHEDFWGFQIDKMTDKQFLKHAPECAYSLLVLDASILTPITGQEKRALLNHAIKTRAAMRRRSMGLDGMTLKDKEAMEMDLFLKHFHTIPTPHDMTLIDNISL